MTTTTTTTSCSLDHRPAAASIQKIHRCRSRWKRSSVTVHSSAVTSGERGHMKNPQDLYILIWNRMILIGRACTRSSCIPTPRLTNGLSVVYLHTVKSSI
ncbi:hypothetical protein B296_00025058 [Ensete ventricosum]|uniref:Uncharacterized protein n=1 Tax=Ensete ventricosum TaxID=4639 RepID=A0A426ZMW9_ENSVE|nr:hypothetical protein B296_00025058 [Ensete ventricosum]